MKTRLKAVAAPNRIKVKPMNETNNKAMQTCRGAKIQSLAVLSRVTILLSLFCLSVWFSNAQTAQPGPKPTSQPVARRPLPKLLNGARGFDTSSKDSRARLIAIGGGYGGGGDDEPLPKLKRKTAEGYYQWGLDLYGAAQNKAIAAFEQAIKLNPNFVKAYWELGNAYAEYNNLVESEESKYDDQESYRRAIAAFAQVRRLQPGRAGVYNNLAILYFNTGQYEKAISAFQTGLRLKPKGAKENNVSLMEDGVLGDSGIYSFIGDAYERLNKNTLALAFYQGALRSGFESGSYLDDLNVRLGFVCEKLGDVDKAIAAYEAINLDEGLYDMRVDVTRRLGLLYATTGKYEQAIEYFERAISGYEGALEVSKTNTPTADNADNAEELKEWKEEVQRNKTGLASAAYNLGVVYLTLNQQEKATVAFQKAIEADPGNAEAHFNLGFAYLTLGNKKAAQEQARLLKGIDSELSKELEALINK
jgi:tetratricopeptide (TPR) repeat protein